MKPPGQHQEQMMLDTRVDPGRENEAARSTPVL